MDGVGTAGDTFPSGIYVYSIYLSLHVLSNDDHNRSVVVLLVFFDHAATSRFHSVVSLCYFAVALLQS